ncbi:MAG: hypothetical protein ABI823_18570, partial [Bryobacteraceae bacterium]
YIIAYTPHLADDGSYRQIKVSVAGHGGAQVRTRSGYYATPTPPAKPGAKEALSTKPKSSQN